MTPPEKMRHRAVVAADARALVARAVAEIAGEMQYRCRMLYKSGGVMNPEPIKTNNERWRIIFEANRDAAIAGVQRELAFHPGYAEADD